MRVGWADLLLHVILPRIYVSHVFRSRNKVGGGLVTQGIKEYGSAIGGLALGHISNFMMSSALMDLVIRNVLMFYLAGGLESLRDLQANEDGRVGT